VIFIFIPQSVELPPDPYIHGVQIKLLNGRYKMLDSQIDFLRKNQNAMSRQIKELKQKVAANNANTEEP
jgi:chaperonin cofactor prefoldin